MKKITRSDLIEASERIFSPRRLSAQEVTEQSEAAFARGATTWTSPDGLYVCERVVSRLPDAEPQRTYREDANMRERGF